MHARFVKAFGCHPRVVGVRDCLFILGRQANHRRVERRAQLIHHLRRRNVKGGRGPFRHSIARRRLDAVGSGVQHTPDKHRVLRLAELCAGTNASRHYQARVPASNGW